MALLALVKAAHRFDPSKQNAFSTYASACVVGELKRPMRDKTWAMRVSRSVGERYLAVKEARDHLAHSYRRSPTIAEIADWLGCSSEQVLEAMEAGSNYYLESLDRPITGPDGRDGDTAAVPTEDPGFDQVLDRADFAARAALLTDREKLVLRRLYLDDRTQKHVAEEIGTTQMHVSRLRDKTVAKLRPPGPVRA